MRNPDNGINPSMSKNVQLFLYMELHQCSYLHPAAPTKNMRLSVSVSECVFVFLCVWQGEKKIFLHLSLAD